AVFAARGYVNDERLELQRAAATAAASARGDGVTVPALRVDRSEIIASIYDSSGHLIDGPGPRQGDALVRTAMRGAEATTTTGNTIVVAAPVSDGDQVSGVVVLRTDLAAAHHRALIACLIIAAMGAVAVLIAAVGARLVARRLSAPIDRLRAGARDMGAGDLDARVAASGIAEFDVLTATMNDAAARIQSMIGRERSLSAEVSHQLRTPLTGLRLELERLQTSYPTDPRVEQALRSADRLADTVTDIIALARDLPEGQHCFVEDLLTGVTQRWYALLVDATRPLRVTSASDVPSKVAISSAAATQILDILIDNARAHGRGAVTVHARALGTAVAFDVSDEGDWPEREAHQMFAARNGSRPGGIGLPFARKLAEAEHARVTVTSHAPPTFSLVVRGSPEGIPDGDGNVGDPGRQEFLPGRGHGEASQQRRPSRAPLS
ncbi:MAG: HAMP domain-containing histidine kinase, partial [Actinomycetota bacterium]|nr:HAMP domain-containing histidine kinase [Actinomycetota bacterium]